MQTITRETVAANEIEIGRKQFEAMRDAHRAAGGKVRYHGPLVTLVDDAGRMTAGAMYHPVGRFLTAVINKTPVAVRF